ASAGSNSVPAAEPSTATMTLIAAITRVGVSRETVAVPVGDRPLLGSATRSATVRALLGWPSAGCTDVIAVVDGAAPATGTDTRANAARTGRAASMDA